MKHEQILKKYIHHLRRVEKERYLESFKHQKIKNLRKFNSKDNLIRRAQRIVKINMKKIQGTQNNSSEGKMNNYKKIFFRTNTFVDVKKLMR